MKNIVKLLLIFFVLIISSCEEASVTQDEQYFELNSKWLTGERAPSPNEGENGDLYLNTDTGDIYLKYEDSWIFLTNITGADGATGATGADGADGTIWYYGTMPPGSYLGNNGDFYLNTETGEIFLKQENTWISLIDSIFYQTPTMKVATPEILPAGGEFQEYIMVSIVCDTEDATILYSTSEDGISFLYSQYIEPFAVSCDTYVKAYAVKSLYEDSDIKEVMFTIDESSKIELGTMFYGFTTPEDSVIAYFDAVQGEQYSIHMFDYDCDIDFYGADDAVFTCYRENMNDIYFEAFDPENMIYEHNYTKTIIALQNERIYIVTRAEFSTISLCGMFGILVNEIIQ